MYMFLIHFHLRRIWPPTLRISKRKHTFHRSTLLFITWSAFSFICYLSFWKYLSFSCLRKTTQHFFNAKETGRRWWYSILRLSSALCSFLCVALKANPSVPLTYTKDFLLQNRLFASKVGLTQLRASVPPRLFTDVLKWLPSLTESIRPGNDNATHEKVKERELYLEKCLQ